jgi:glutamine cyclotransferase
MSANDDHCSMGSSSTPDDDKERLVRADGDRGGRARQVHGERAAAAQTGTPVYRYRFVNSYPHDTQAYTQGLVSRRIPLREHGALRTFESEKGKASDRRDSSRTTSRCAVLCQGSGGLGGGRLIQLTWQTNVGFVYDLATFRLERSFRFTEEGCGLTRDANWLIMSDGSDTLRFPPQGESMTAGESEGGPDVA